MTVAQLSLVAFAVFLGSVLNGVVGFGFALVTVPLISIAAGPKEAVVLSALFGLLSNTGVSIRHRDEIEVPVVRRIVLGAVLGMPAGLVVILVVPEAPLKVAISTVVLVSVGLLARGWVIHDPPHRVDVLTGVISGALNTSVGISGPPVVMNLQGRRLAKGPFRASAACVFALSGVVALALFGVAGQIHPDTVLAAAVAVLAWPLGWFVGDLLHHRFDEERFRSLVLVLLVATALLTLATVVGEVWSPWD
jgi:uncharacterized membrane protein YfcA